MKRTLFRLAALGIVVGLGLIAIAQIQRGQPAKTPPDTAAAATVVPAERPAAPALMPPDPGAKPLRPLGVPINSPPPLAVDPPPGRPGPGDAPSSVAADPPLGENPLRKSSVEPFGLRNERAGNPVRPASAEVARNDGRYPAPPSDAGESSAYPAPDRYPGPPPGGNRYPVPPPADRRSDHPRREAAEGREPAPFRADPSAAPANLSRGPLVGNESLPPGDDAAGDGAALEGAGRPGGKQLEGPQTPQITIQKIAPPEVQVGKPAAFRITVRNTGPVAAGNVEVHDQVPRGARLVGSTPRASRGTRGELVFALGTLKPGEQATVELQLMPTTEGEIGSVASVRFDAEASSRSVCTRPKLVVATAGNNRVLAGEQVNLTITVSNPGSGVATGVVLEEHIPAGLQHPAGSDLEYAVGDLRPGESRKLDLQLLARQPGTVANILTARGDGGLRTEDRFELDVIAPQLDIAVAGPKRRYLERQAAYQFAIANPGTAPAQQVELVAYLPNGLKFVSANNAGHYDEANRAVHWRLEELPTSEKGVVELVTMPVEAGQQTIKIRGTARQGLVVEKEQPVLVEGIAAVSLQVTDRNGPIEVGGQTTYEIRVTNQGSKDATNVQVMAVLPPEIKPLAADGPTRYAIEGNRVVFDGLARLAPKADATYHVRAQGLQAGDLRIRCQLLTGEMQAPLIREERTQVYADQ